MKLQDIIKTKNAINEAFDFDSIKQRDNDDVLDDVKSYYLIDIFKQIQTNRTRDCLQQMLGEPDIDFSTKNESMVYMLKSGEAIILNEKNFNYITIRTPYFISFVYKTYIEFGHFFQSRVKIKPYTKAWIVREKDVYKTIEYFYTNKDGYNIKDTFQQMDLMIHKMHVLTEAFDFNSVDDDTDELMSTVNNYIKIFDKDAIRQLLLQQCGIKLPKSVIPTVYIEDIGWIYMRKDPENNADGYLLNTNKECSKKNPKIFKANETGLAKLWKDEIELTKEELEYSQTVIQTLFPRKSPKKTRIRQIDYWSCYTDKDKHIFYWEFLEIWQEGAHSFIMLNPVQFK